MGLTYKSLGNYEQAEAHVREALKILEPNPEGDLFKGEFLADLRTSSGLPEGRCSCLPNARVLVLDLSSMSD